MKKRRIGAEALARKRRALLEKLFCPEGTILVAENDFEKKLLNTKGAIVVKFWDGTPHLAQEAFSSVAHKYSEDIKFACILVKDKQLRSKYDIRYSPTFVFFEDGQEKSRISGATPPDALDVWCEVNRS
jgi:thioredoxin-like negative regulator of GroEL